MNLAHEIDEALKYVQVFSFQIFGVTVSINETLVISWIVMALLVIVSLLLTRKLKTIPRGPQALAEAAVEFLNNFSSQQFGRRQIWRQIHGHDIFHFIQRAHI